MSHKGILLLFCIFLWSPICFAGKNKGDISDNFSIGIGNVSPVEVGVLTPSGKFIFLRNSEINCQGVSVMNGEVSIRPSKSIGVYWNSKGEKNTVATFAEQGIFTIYVSDNLETEIDNSSSVSRKYMNTHPRKIKFSGDSCKIRRND